MKKALILAGGKGTRLLPLTVFTPKPLVPFFDKTLCERIVLQLKSCGFSDIIFSVGYQKEKIKQLFGESYRNTRIHYIEEDTPLGTAGALFYVRDHWKFEKNESFAVVSGDCLFDFSLRDAISTHQNTNADITILSSKAKEPIEYGIINSDKSGKILGFNEKPAWSQVTGCNVNTGIYLIKSEITHLVPKGTFDFSNDLFPLMLRKNMHLQEYKTDGFWSDIGTPESYYHAITNALDGKLKHVPQTSTDKLRKVEKNGVRILHPSYISDSAEIGPCSVIGPYSVISDNVVIKSDCCISRSVIHGNTDIGKGTKTDGAVICSNSDLGDYCLVNESSVIQENSVVSEHGVISAGKVIFNDDYSEKPAKEYFKTKSPLFFNDAILISHKDNRNRWFEVSEKICYSLVSASSKNAKFGIMSEDSHHCTQFAQHLIFAAENMGAKICCFGEGFEKLAGYVTASLRFDCFLYIFEKNEEIYCKLFNKNSLPPSRDFERRFEFFFYNTPENIKTQYYPSKNIKNSEFFYRNEIQECLLSYCSEHDINDHPVSFINPKEPCREFFIFKQTFTEIGGNICGLKEAYDDNRLIIKYSAQKGIAFEQGGICANKYSLTGAILKEEKEHGVTEFLLPVCHPNRYNSLFDKMDKIYSYPVHSSRRFDIPPHLIKSHYWLMDDILIASKALSLVAKKGCLADIIKNSTNFFYTEDVVFLPEDISNADMMEKISRNGKNKINDCFEGTVIEFPDGKVTVIPQNGNCLKIYTEAQNENSARNLFKRTENLILS